MHPPERECILTAADPTAGLIRAVALPPAPAGLVLAAPEFASAGQVRVGETATRRKHAKGGSPLIRFALRLWTWSFLLVGGWYASAWTRLGHAPMMHEKPSFGIGAAYTESVLLPVSLLHLTGGLLLASFGLILFTLQRESRMATRLLLLARFPRP